MKRRQFLQTSIGLVAAIPLWYWIKPAAAAGAKSVAHILKNSGASLQALPILKNESTAKGIFKATLTVSATDVSLLLHKNTQVWAYNESIPGPQIIVTEGDKVEILVENHLSENTTVHWHGLDVPDEQDGRPDHVIEPHSDRLYQFTVPKGSQGTYWYHPHPHHRTAEQVAMGLAGTFIVKPAMDVFAGWSDQHWFISDIRVDENAQISPHSPADWMDGREGDIVLINGQHTPKIDIKSQTKLRIWNACAARYLQLEIPDCEWIIVGSDGGLLEQPMPAQKRLFLAPAERVEVIVKPNKIGVYPLKMIDYDRQKMAAPFVAKESILADVNVQKQDISKIPTTLRVIEALGAAKASHKVVLSENMHDMHASQQGTPAMPAMASMDHSAHTMSAPSTDVHQGHGTNTHTQTTRPATMANVFLINGKSFDMNRVDFKTKVGQVDEWIVQNDSHMDHPFHIHGGQFQVLERGFNLQQLNRVPLAWKDSINLKPKEIVRLTMRHTFAGKKMLHCHILEHEDLGMMAVVQVDV